MIISLNLFKSEVFNLISLSNIISLVEDGSKIVTPHEVSDYRYSAEKTNFTKFLKIKNNDSLFYISFLEIIERKLNNFPEGFIFNDK